MTDTYDNVSIDFSSITVTIGDGRLELVRCQRCRALLLPDDAQDHANWHGALNRSVKSGGLGFGPPTGRVTL